MSDVTGGDFSGSDGTVTDMGSWYTVATIRTDWNGAPANDAVLQQLLDAAKQQVLAFDEGYNWRANPANSGTPFPGDYTAVPTNLLMAQRMQARNLNNASKVDPSSGAMGDDTYTLRPFPLDWVIKQVIRPKRAVGVSFG